MTVSQSAHHPDTVSDAAATPEREMPYAELGLKEDEYRQIVDLLGRRPTAAELAMYSVMWSEHCSYKSSKVHLKQFGDKTTAKMKEHLLVGIGQNAGVVDVGDGWAVTFKVESHNHPSYVEPYQGAATGVGGIVRDIISMGARPIAVMDQLRFGAIDHPDTQRVVHGVVAGIGGYGNCLGLPNIGGETEFDPCYQGNPLVNALCVGVLRHDDIHLANAEGEGNHVVLFGARTGGDGIGGASILASETFDEGGPTKRPSVQVGDPFMEKLLIECCLELFEKELVEAIQDLGAAGISCATSELASNGNSGMHVDLEKVLLRDPTLTAGEILMSESQERMMAIVAPEKLDAFLAVTAKWEVETAVIGEVTGDGRLTIDHFGERIVDVDPTTVAHDGPEYHRPFSRPAWLDKVRADSAATLPRATTLAQAREEIIALAGSANCAAVDWITSQYDRYVQGNTALAQPDDAGVVRVDEASGLGVAISADAIPRFAYLDPYTGAQAALAEAYRNVAVVGAHPRAVTDCLNFGSPEREDSMWQLVEAITGLADGCRELGIPVTGGNVSLYNTTGEESIHPTPVVGVLGVMDDVSRVVPSGWYQAGQKIVLLGDTADELDGSEWARALHEHLGGMPPQVDLAAERDLASVLIALSEQGISRAAHDLSRGGLAQALVDMARRFGHGADIDLSGVADDLDLTAVLFSESGARALVVVDNVDLDHLQALADRRGVPCRVIGVTASVEGDHEQALSLRWQGEECVLPLAELDAAATATLPRYFG